eukprot:TRINITY_DN10833_c0_g1_i11.p3 TRINITY_DN10833_c0_g1~~TRINITY_DN10833_c0_g1_i11.p3  ORF type:complete len:128 (-),score=3.59 TRINITY_DN10833_c0_g1_i11:134-517(-)
MLSQSILDTLYKLSQTNAQQQSISKQKFDVRGLLKTALTPSCADKHFIKRKNTLHIPAKQLKKAPAIKDPLGVYLQTVFSNLVKTSNKTPYKKTLRTQKIVQNNPLLEKGSQLRLQTQRYTVKLITM